MRPILFDLPIAGSLHLALPAYGTFLVLGMLAAAWAAGRQGRHVGMTRLDAFDLGLWLLLAGLVGAHLLYVQQHAQTYLRAGLWAGLRQGGLVYYGGLAAAFPALWLWGRRRRLRYLDLLDFVAPLAALGLAITRIGCFWNGCCFGAPSAVPWAVAFPRGSLAHRTQLAVGLVGPGEGCLPVHPVQLYEAAAGLAIFWWLWARSPWRRYRGQVVIQYGFVYGAWRLLAEALRADSPGWRPDRLAVTPQQWLSLALIAIAAAGWWAARRFARNA